MALYKFDFMLCYTSYATVPSAKNKLVNKIFYLYRILKSNTGN